VGVHVGVGTSAVGVLPNEGVGVAVPVDGGSRPMGRGG
jgi:hypothetical protein